MAFSDGVGTGGADADGRTPLPRVLIVDDDSRYLRSLTTLVAAHGYPTRGARTVTDALETVRTWHPEVILLDVRLAGGNGFTLFEGLPKPPGPLPAPDVVVVSGDTRFDTAVWALRMGAADFLAKPCRPEALLAVLDRLVARRRSSLPGAGNEPGAGAAPEASPLPASRGRPIRSGPAPGVDGTDRAAALTPGAGAAAALPALPDPTAVPLAPGVLEEAPFLVYTLDADGRFTFLNRRAEDLFRVDRRDLLQKPWTALVFGEEQMARARYRLNERRRGARATYNQPLVLSRPAVDGDGPDPVHLTLTAQGLYRRINGDEAFAGTCGIAAPNGARTLDGIDAVLASLPLPVLFLDAGTGAVLEVNDGARARTGPLPLTGADVAAGLRIPQAAWEAFLLEALDGGPLRRALGAESGFPAWQAVTVPLDDGERIAILLDDLDDAIHAHEDRLLLERTLQQEARLDSVRHLGGGIAHDFNNLLASIIGFTELALAQLPGAGDHTGDGRGTTPDPRALELAGAYLNECLEASGRARDLVQGILRFSHPQDGGGSVRDARPVLTAQLDRVRAVLPRSIDLRAQLDDAGVALQIDAARLGRIVVQLLANARRALCGPGEIELTAQVVSGDEGPCAACRREITGEHLRITVRDSGRGLPPGLGRDPFRVLARTSATPLASGSELAAVSAAAHEGEGHVQLRSIEGLGTAVSVHLPLLTSRTRIPGTAGAPLVIAEGQLSIGWLVCETLELLGCSAELLLDPYRVEERLDGEDAMPRLVLVNADIGAAHGERLVDRLARHPRAPPLVAIVGPDTAPLPPGVGRLPRPFDPATLARVVLPLLDGG